MLQALIRNALAKTYVLMENLRKLSLNYHQILSLSVPLGSTLFVIQSASLDIEVQGKNHSFQVSG